jgi:lysophospholipase L1-like esterase
MPQPFSTRFLLGLFLLLTNFPARAASESPARWEKDIQAFEAADKTNPPPSGVILFVGSSSIRLWKTLTDDFKGLPVLNRGFGGSQMADSAFFVDRIVLPYHPRQIVVYAGDNDLAAGKPPTQILLDFQAFVRKVRDVQPNTRISFIAIKPSPSRWKLIDKILEANRLIAEFTHTEKGMDYIDVFTPMLAADGHPRPDLFAADNLHLNGKGYDLWTTTVRPFLSKEGKI